MMERCKWMGLMLTFGLMLQPGCGEEFVPVSTVPVVDFLDSSSLVIGEPLSFYGQNFLSPAEGRTMVVFDGEYVWMDDQGNQVPEFVAPFAIAPLYDGEFLDGGKLGANVLPAGTEVLRWNRFGPFTVPFTATGNKPGTFVGSVYAINQYEDGTQEVGPKKNDVQIQVKPSILIRKLEPVVDFEDGEIVTADCGNPALRALGGLPYVIEVEAMGFYPEYFIYEMTNINDPSDPQAWTSFTHQAVGSVDRLGDPAWATWLQNEIVVFNPVPEDIERSISSIRITAVDANDNHYHTAIPLSVVRPIQFHYDGSRQLAELYEPVAVHGPITGSIGTVLTYAETHSESRQNSVSVNVSESFSASQGSISNSNWSEGVSETSSSSQTNSIGQSHSESENASETYGTSYSTSDQNSSNVSSTDGTQWGWNLNEGTNEENFVNEAAEVYGEVSGSVNTEVSGEGSIPGFAKVGGKVGTTVGAKTGGKKGTTVGEKVGSNSSVGEHMYESESDTVAFGSVTTDSNGESMSGTYGLASQSTSSSQTAETNVDSESVTYQMGGSDGLTENYTKGSQESWSESWVTTEQDTTMFAYTSKVPNGKCAVVYRQTVRYVRRAQLYNYDLCGVRSLMGEAMFNEWSWSPNITVADNCDQGLPPSDLPTAKCLIACD